MRFHTTASCARVTSSTAGNKTDGSLRAEVLDAIAHCHSLRDHDITVVVKKAVVNLNGTVTSLDNRHLAAEAAWMALGTRAPRTQPHHGATRPGSVSRPISLAMARWVI